MEKAWRQSARLKLKFELAGLSFALKHSFSPREYARHLWSKGAAGWLGKPDPSPEEYVNKEADASRQLLPGVHFEVILVSPREARIVFQRGCPGGWGHDQWSVARQVGLTKKDVCRYCQAAFEAWAEEVNLQACPSPQPDETCILTVTKTNSSRD